MRKKERQRERERERERDWNVTVGIERRDRKTKRNPRILAAQKH